MVRNVAKNLEVNRDLDITIEMESANQSVERTLGLGKTPVFLENQGCFLQARLLFGAP